LKGKNIQEIINYKWPDLKNWNTDALRIRARYLYEETDYAIAAKSVFDGAGLFERCYYLRTIEEFFIDMMENESIARFLIDKISDIEIQLWDMFLSAVGPYIHIVQRAMDLGTQTGLFISPELFRKYLKPAEEKIYRFIKSKAPQVKILFHSCGAIVPLIEDFIDLGTDILNPVQPLATGMDPAFLKKNYGDRLCFHGGIDLQKALPGSIADVKDEVRKRVRAFAPGGGYILAAANHIQKDTPPENIITLYDYAREFGKYPIK
jgi:uroporphyrinogen decarboxylase